MQLYPSLKDDRCTSDPELSPSELETSPSEPDCCTSALEASLSEPKISPLELEISLLEGKVSFSELQSCPFLSLSFAMLTPKPTV